MLVINKLIVLYLLIPYGAKEMNKEKILLFAGTAESTEISQKVIELGYELTLSTVTDDKKLIHSNLNITRKIGRMNLDEISAYLKNNNFKAVICAVHPYAAAARSNIITACKKTETTIYIYLRDNSKLAEFPEGLEIFYAAEHIEAAKIANEFPGNILLTTGSRNLFPYMDNIINSQNRIYARVLNSTESEEALTQEGIAPEHSILARGPFSIAENINTIKKYNISILITKDGGINGGTPEKLIAAAKTSCKVIMISRPQITETYFTNIDELLKQL